MIIDSLTNQAPYQAILFDLDGTLLHMREREFVRGLIGGLVSDLSSDPSLHKPLALALQDSLIKVLQNDGSCTNRQAFIRYYEDLKASTGLCIDIDRMECFYKTKFAPIVQNTCGEDPEATDLVAYIKHLGIPMVVATNPFFPQFATHTRIRRAGLDPADFLEITTYEHYHYCKPNPAYYRELFERTGLDPKRCLMVGNNVDEDMIAGTLGCDVFLVLRDLINQHNADITQFPHGSLADVKTYLQNKQ